LANANNYAAAIPAAGLSTDEVQAAASVVTLFTSKMTVTEAI
jgi:hypothetical protein